MHEFDLIRHPSGLVLPKAIDAPGGPTRDEAYGPNWRRTSQGLFVPSRVERAGHQRTLEVGRGLPAGAAVSGSAALNFLGVNMVPSKPVDMVSPGNFRPPADARRHRRPVPRGEAGRYKAIWLTRPEVALFDAIVWEPDDREAVAIADMALATLIVDRCRMEVLLAEGRRHSARVARILAMAEMRTRSPQETALRLIWLLDLLLPKPLCNWPIRNEYGEIIAEGDLLSMQLGVVGEYNGAAHEGMRRRERDAAKLDAYRRLGLEPFTLVASDMHHPERVKSRILGAIERADPARMTCQVETNPPWRP